MPGLPDHPPPASSLWIETIARTALWWSCATLLLWLRPEGIAHRESLPWFALVASPAAVLLLASAFQTFRLRLGYCTSHDQVPPAARVFSAMEIALTFAVATAIAV